MRISVVIPCRDAGDLLVPAIRSVLNQTRPPDEVIVADDGSTDGSLERAAAFGGIVQALRADGGGASATRLAGLAAASGNALMFLDADDLLGPTALERLAAALGRRPGEVACCPWYRLAQAGACWIAEPPSCAPRRPGQDDLAAWLTGWYHPPCSVLWSRAAYERSGGWDPHVPVNNDGDVMMRGLVAGNRLVPTDGGAAYYRRPPAGRVSLSGTRTTRRGVGSRLAVLRRIEDRLAERGRLARYRTPLAEAYAALAADCGDDAGDLAAACAEAARRHAGPAWLEPVRRLRFRAGRKAGHVAGLVRAATTPPRAGPGVALPDRLQPTSADPAPAPPERVSVVIPTYNRVDLLPRAIDSALAQDHPDFEVIVVDDASTDATAERVAGYRDGRLRYLRQPVNRGVAAARNRGIAAATGSLVAFLDSDDAWLPGKLSRQAAAFAAGGDRVGLVYTGVETVASDGRRHVDIASVRGDLHAPLLLRNLLVGGSCAMVRAAVFDTVGGFDEDLPAIEDYDLWVRIARFYDVEAVPEPLVRYDDRIGADFRSEERRSRNFAANFRAREAFYRRNRHEMEAAGLEHLFLFETAKRHLRWPAGDAVAARRALVRAVARRPASPLLHLWLAYAYLPGGGRPAAEALARRLRGFGAAGRRTDLSEGVQ